MNICIKFDSVLLDILKGALWKFCVVPEASCKFKFAESNSER